MIYKTILTEKGTTTIPKDIRKKLGLKSGMLVSFVQNDETGDFIIKRSRTIDEIREANMAAMQLAKTTGKEYTSGAGFGTHIDEKFEG
jgi:AbrB family looped-hinge helix DNA binding protein